MNILWFFICALAAIWLFVAGTPYENTLWLAATGKVNLGISLFYRFRDSSIVTDGSWGGAGLKGFLEVCSLIGVRTTWCATILPQALLLRQTHWKIKLFSSLLLLAALLWGEALLAWNLLFTLLVYMISTLATTRTLPAALTRLIALAGFLGAVELTWILGNPARLLIRQRVLGGESYSDSLRLKLRKPAIELHENCVAVINPDDLRGVQSVELLSQATLARFEAVILLDLKMVDANYRFLMLKDEKGEFIFSNAARKFAEKERAYAAAVRARLNSAANLCLIAPFDRLPELESAPFSRAREIFDARRKAGLPTKVIQLPAA